MTAGPVSPQLATIDLTPLRDALDVVDALIRDDWTCQDDLGNVTLSRASCPDPRAALRDLQRFGRALGHVQALGSLAGQDLRLRLINGSMEVVDVPNATPDDWFDDPDTVARAHAAWEGNAQEALDLPLAWEVTADLALERLLPLPDGIEMRISAEVSTILHAFTASSVVTLGRLIPQAAGVRRIYLALRGDGHPVHLGSVTFAGAARQSTLDVPADAEPLAGERPLLEGFPMLPPHALVRLDHHSTGRTAGDLEWAPVARHCAAVAALSAWSMSASEIENLDDRPRLAFLGFKRVRLELPSPDSLDDSAVTGALALRRWMFHDASPDRLLAVRQVVSLYEQGEPFAVASDVQASAEVIYAGLRSEAVAEVVKGTREAQAQANDTVRQGLRASQELVKAATERFLAALIAVGAVIIANASRSLADEVSRNLMLLIAGFLLVLALIAVLVEGPLLSLPIRHLSKDVRAGSSLLTPEQQREIVESAAVRATRRRIVTVRVVVPVLYLSLSIAIVLWGYPARYI
jgi:hypothetical protein